MTALLPAASRIAGAPKASGSAPPVRLDGIARSFPLAQGRREVLRGVDLDNAAGEIDADAGPTG